VDEATFQTCQELVGYCFRDTRLLGLALTHASVAPTRSESNERLEFLGDAVLDLVVCHDLYARHEELLEGDMTKIKSAVVSRRTCAEIADELGLSRLLRLGKGMAGPNDLPQSVAAAVLEAIIGAMYLDGGLEPCRTFILAHVRPHIEKVLADTHEQNYKSLLQQHCQHRWSTTPEYRLLDEKGPDHCKAFEVAVVLNGRHFPSAWGNSKKSAEQQAARAALISLGQLDD